MNRVNSRFLLVSGLLITGSVLANGQMLAPDNPGARAFGKYVDSLHKRDPFTASGPIGLLIEASVPALRQNSRMVAIREIGESERTEYTVLANVGDPGPTREVIMPFLDEQRQIEDLPLSSLMITPANYKFRYLGEGVIDGLDAAVFRIVPKRKSKGLIRG